LKLRVESLEIGAKLLEKLVRIGPTALVAVH
jgi:hypothetical protein